MKKISYVMSVLVFILIAFSSCAKSSPEAAVKSFMKSYQKGDYIGLVEQIHFSKTLTEEEKAGYVDLLAQKGGAELAKKQGIVSYEIGEVTMAEDGQSAKVVCTANYGDGTSSTDKYNVVLVDGKWMIDGGK